MLANKWLLIEIVLTLTATGALMWFIRRRQEFGSYGSLMAALAGILLLCALHAVGLPSAGYILAGLVALMAGAYLIGMLFEM